MRLFLQLALLAGIALWAVLEFYYKTEIALLNAVLLVGIILAAGNGLMSSPKDKSQ